MSHMIGDIMLAVTVLMLSVQNYRNSKHIANIEKWILMGERKNEHGKERI